MPHGIPDKESQSETIERLARELVEASRTIELLASRAAEQLEATFFSYSRDLRKRAEAHLPKTDQCELDLEDQGGDAPSRAKAPPPR